MIRSGDDWSLEADFAPPPRFRARRGRVFDSLRRRDLALATTSDDAPDVARLLSRVHARQGPALADERVRWLEEQEEAGGWSERGSSRAWRNWST